MVTQTFTHKEKNMSKDSFTNNMPQFKVNQSRNGYEIRTDLLHMAKDLVTAEYSMKFSGWEMSAKRDDKTNQIVSTVEMPKFPGIEQVLETAEKMYQFVSAKSK